MILVHDNNNNSNNNNNINDGDNENNNGIDNDSNLKSDWYKNDDNNNNNNINQLSNTTEGTTKKPRVCVHNSESPQEREFGLEISCHAHYLILSNSRVSLRHEVCSYHTKPHSSLFVLSIISEYFMLVIIIIIIIIIIFIDRYDRYH